MSKIEVDISSLTPEQLAEAFWGFDTEQQCVFFEHLLRVSQATYEENVKARRFQLDQWMMVRDTANRLPADRRSDVVEMIQRIAVWHMPLWATATDGEFFGGTPAEAA